MSVTGDGDCNIHLRLPGLGWWAPRATLYVYLHVL